MGRTEHQVNANVDDWVATDDAASGSLADSVLNTRNELARDGATWHCIHEHHAVLHL